MRCTRTLNTPSTTAWAPSGASRSSVCRGPCSTPLRWRRSRPASRPSDDFNRGNNEGVGYFEVNQKRGVRWNASKAFLRPVQQRRNLEVRTGAMVTRLVIERRGDGALHAAGVEVRTSEGAHTLRAARAVVIRVPGLHGQRVQSQS